MASIEGFKKNTPKAHFFMDRFWYKKIKKIWMLISWRPNFLLNDIWPEMSLLYYWEVLWLFNLLTLLQPWLKLLWTTFWCVLINAIVISSIVKKRHCKKCHHFLNILAFFTMAFSEYNPTFVLVYVYTSDLMQSWTLKQLHNLYCGL